LSLLSQNDLFIFQALSEALSEALLEVLLEGLPGVVAEAEAPVLLVMLLLLLHLSKVAVVHCHGWMGEPMYTELIF
jgi:hypothetical protein